MKEIRQKSNYTQTHYKLEKTKISKSSREEVQVMLKGKEIKWIEISELTKSSTSSKKIMR